jgi:hypothetical protein
MEPVTRLPITRALPSPVERDLAEIDTAIELVRRGLATRIRLVGLMRPDGVASVGLARAQAAGLLFVVDREPDGVASLTVGPRIHRQRVD